MTLYEFNSLTRADQEDVIHQQSEFLHVDKKDGLCYGLYAKDKFFIELVCYEDSLAIKNINTFKTGKLLDKYALLVRQVE